MNWVEITIAVILLIGIIVGIVRGSLKSAVSILTSVIIIAAAAFLTPYVTKYAAKYTPVGDMVKTKVESTFAEAAENKLQEEIKKEALTYDAVEKVFDAAGIDEDDLEEFGITIADIVQGNVTMSELSEYGISSNLLQGIYRKAEANTEAFDPVAWAEGLSTSKQYAAIEASDLPAEMKTLLNDNNTKEMYQKLGAENFLDYVGLFMADVYTKIICFFVLFLLVGLIVRAIIFALDIVTGLPSKGILNRFAGGILGIADVLIIIWVLLIIVSLTYSTEAGQLLHKMIMDQPYTKLIYEMNPIWNFLTSRFW